MPKFLGLATISFDGQVISTAKGASLDVGGIKRNPVVSGRRVGFAEEIIPATIECETVLEEGASLEAFRNIKGATITFAADTGQTYVVRDGFLTDPPKLKDGEGGNVELKFAGPPAEEVV